MDRDVIVTEELTRYYGSLLAVRSSKPQGQDARKSGTVVLIFTPRATLESAPVLTI